VRLEEQLSFSVYSTMLAFNKAYKPLLASLDLTYSQYLAMLVLWERDVIPLGDIGERLFLDSGALTPLLKRLEGAGLVRRARDPGDERVVLITLTDAGRNLRSAATEVAVGITHALGLAPALSEQLRMALNEMRRRLS